MAKDRAPKEILKDKRSRLSKLLDDLDNPMIEKLFKDMRKMGKSEKKGNPREAGASIEITKIKESPKGSPKPIQKPKGGRFTDKDRDLVFAKAGGLMEATARLKAKGMKEGGMVVKEKVVAIDKSPNSGLITVKGFGAGRRT